METENTIECYLNSFKEIISILDISDNIAIGGYQALKLHGLNLNRPPADMDLIIFQPTPKQIEILQVLKVYDLIRNRPKDILPEEIKAYKFKKHDMYMDVIISDKMMPSLLSFTCHVGTFKVNSIQNVIEAKASYKFRYNERAADGYGDETNLYARAKDMLDFQQLKNLNFNFGK